jgi:hypothetical protein
MAALAPVRRSTFHAVPLRPFHTFVRDGLMTKEEAETLDIEAREDLARKVLTMLDHLASVGTIVPRPENWHLHPVRIQYADL